MVTPPSEDLLARLQEACERLAEAQGEEYALRQKQAEIGGERMLTIQEIRQIRTDIVTEGVKAGLTQVEMGRRTGLNPRRLEFQQIYRVAKARVAHEAR